MRARRVLKVLRFCSGLPAAKSTAFGVWSRSRWRIAVSMTSKLRLKGKMSRGSSRRAKMGKRPNAKSVLRATPTNANTNELRDGTNQMPDSATATNAAL